MVKDNKRLATGFSRKKKPYEDENPNTIPKDTLIFGPSPEIQGSCNKCVAALTTTPSGLNHCVGARNYGRSPRSRGSLRPCRGLGVAQLTAAFPGDWHSEGQDGIASAPNYVGIKPENVFTHAILNISHEHQSLPGNLGHNKKRPNQPHQSTSLPRTNQVVPNSSSEQTNQQPIQTINNLVPVSCYPEVPQRANALPALPAPPRRRLISEMELANALSVLQQQQQRCASRRPSYRRRRRSVVHRTKTPALSPIRESGLSNPASPSRQNCTVSASGAGIRPI
ncbi:hypothetical protein JTB14_027691 [Gonioctena quinquepunctata]|nr:hypothetical protein JTB14_027691 [Gonioctena quinquepunctata]